MATVTTRTRIKVEGLDRLNKNIKGLKTDLFGMLADAALAGADIVKDSAKSKARRKSGMLAQGIVSVITWDKKAPVAFAGAGMDKGMNKVFVKMSKEGKRYYYPSSIEYGHPRARAYPFMRPAMDENKAKVRKAIRDRVKAAIEGAIR